MRCMVQMSAREQTTFFVSYVVVLILSKQIVWGGRVDLKYAPTDSFALFTAVPSSGAA
jgi:hypothetical protein